jgi:hypothetical protein
MSEDYAALWRASAYEAVPYTDDFPECFLTLPEIFDGCVGQGGATRVRAALEILDNDVAWIRVSDNGCGLKSVSRFKHWAAKDAEDNFHRNGHGMKKCMTKFEKDYAVAEWAVSYRRANRDLVRITGPFRGERMLDTDVFDDNVTLMPSGTEWAMKFNPSILGPVLTAGTVGWAASRVANALEELIQTRYSEEILRRIRFELEVVDRRPGAAAEPIRRDSHAEGTEWHSFQWHVEAEAAAGRAYLARDKVVEIPGGRWIYKGYKILMDGRAAYPLKTQFPRYGLRNMLCSRVHVALNGRMIEAIPYYKLMGREANHNDFNGIIEFVNFVADTAADYDKMPVPCTTKVSFYENDETFKEFKRQFQAIQREAGLARPRPATPPVAAAPAAPAPAAQPAAADNRTVSEASSVTASEDSEAEESDAESEAAPPEPVETLEGWGIKLEHLQGRRAISIKIDGGRAKVLTGAVLADFVSIRRRILRCTSADDAKKVLRAWTKIMKQ